MTKYIFLIFIALIVVLRFMTFSNWGVSEGDSNLGGLSSLLDSDRSLISETVSHILPQPQAGLLSGIVFGIKSELPSDFNKALTDTSTVHIVVASGQNLTLLSGFILCLASFFGRKKIIFLIS